MIQRILSAVALVACLAFATNAVEAQFKTSSVVPSIDPASGTIYRLGTDSGHSQGCIPPCLCPVFFDPNLEGTFTLRLVSIGQFARNYAVEQINWTLDPDGTPVKVKGSGTYTRSTSPLGSFHALDLELTVGSAAPVEFASGPVPDPNTFPSLDIAVSDNDVCFATSFAIDSDPAPKKDVRHYALAGSTFQEGCFPPCECPITVPVKVKGTFDLVLLQDQGTVQTFSITNVDWKLVTPAADRFTGTGDYTLIQGFAGPIHSMDLCLSRDGVPLDPFSSGGLSNTTPGPAIEIAVSQNGMFCFDRVFDLRAVPKRKQSLDAAVQAR